MKRDHFHVFDGEEYRWDATGIVLPDLGRVVEEAESKARLVMRSRPDVQEWSKWKVDVRDAADITMFYYPFDDVPELARARSTKAVQRSRLSAA